VSSRTREEKRRSFFLKRILFILSLCLSIIFLDQFTKVLILNKLKPYQTIKIFKYLYLTLVFNKGIAFGLFSKWGGIFLVINSILLIFISSLLFKFLKREMEFSKAIPLIFIFGGAIANIIDRVRLGVIVDFINLRFWPVFNIADSFISLGIILLIYNAFFTRKNL
jgi:signal peptidase II